MILESWIEGFEGSYKVTTEGKILSFLNGDTKEIKPSKHRAGHLTVSLKNEEGTKKFYIHRLVWETFKKEKLTSKQYVLHKNKKSDDNRLINLKVLTPLSKEDVLKKRPYGKRYNYRVIEENGKEVILKNKDDIMKIYGITQPRINEAIKSGDWIEIITKTNL